MQRNETEKREKMNQRDVNRTLINQFVQQQDLNEQQQKTLEQWFLTYESKLQKLYEYYKNVFNSNCDMHTEQGITLPKEQWKSLISGAIELMQRILPLGSVVDLRKERLQGAFPKLEQVEKVRVVITQRFLSYTNEGYFTYAGVIYPVGNLTGSQVIHFNSQMVQKVVHLGYEDEQDSAYVYLTKQEYILQKGKRSYEFASKEEGRKLREKMEGRDVEGNKN